MGQAQSIPKKEIIPINQNYLVQLDRYNKICNKMEKEKEFCQAIEDLIYHHIIGTLKATKYEVYHNEDGVNRKNRIDFYTLTYQGKEYHVSLERIINSLYFIKLVIENGKLQIMDIQEKFDKQIFFKKDKLKPSHEEFFRTMEENLSNLHDQFGQSFNNLMEKCFPQILKFKEAKTFPPWEEWLVHGFNKMAEEINKSLLLMADLKLATNQSSYHHIEELYLEILNFYAEKFKDKTAEDPLHFANFIAFTRERLQYVNEFIKSKNVTAIVDLVRASDKSHRLQTWKDCVKWIRDVLKLNLNHYDPILIDSNEGIEPDENDKDYLRFRLHFVAKPYKFQNPRDVMKNRCHILQTTGIYTPELKKIVEGNDLNAVKVELEKEAEKALRNPKDCIILQTTSQQNEAVVKYVHYGMGLVAELFEENDVKFLKRVFKIDKKDLLTWSAINYLFSKEKCVEIFEKFIDSYKKYSQPDGKQTTRSVRYFLKHRKGETPSCLEKPNSCNCRVNYLSQFYFRKIVLRFLEDRPFMKSASTAALHLLEHGGKSDEEKQQIHKGENLDKHFEAYFKTATDLLKMKEDDVKREGGRDFTHHWVNRHLSSFTYNFSHTGALTINYRKWDGRSQGTFAYITILGDGSIFLKSLFTGYPKDLGQAKCFGLEEKWELYEQNKQNGRG